MNQKLIKYCSKIEIFIDKKNMMLCQQALGKIVKQTFRTLRKLRKNKNLFFHERKNSHIYHTTPSHENTDTEVVEFVEITELGIIGVENISKNCDTLRTKTDDNDDRLVANNEGTQGNV